MATYTVVKGDSLWSIASKKLGSGPRWVEIADLNASKYGISRTKTTIQIGWELELPSSSATPATGVNNNKAVIEFVGPQAGVENTLMASWAWTKANTASYKVKWFYDSGNQRWFLGSETTVDAESLWDKVQTYSVPSNALIVRCRVLPVAKTHKVNNEDVAYWTAEWSTDYAYNVHDLMPPSKPSAPSVSINKYQLTAELNNLDNLTSKASEIQFQVVKNDTDVFATTNVKISTGSVTLTCTVDAGAKYKVRCRGCRNNIYGDWSDYSGDIKTMPATPDGITTIQAKDKTSVYMEWEAVSEAESYDVEYAIKTEYFDNVGTTETVTGIENTNYIKTGLETGHEYFFRIRAVNTAGASGWSEISSVVVGKKPIAPTTWSSSTTAITGEPLNLYWVHNSADGSSQTWAQLEVYVNGQKLGIGDIKNTDDEDEKDKPSVYSINTSDYPEGTKLEWRVRTSGATNEWGDWSVQRTVDIYAPPTITFKVANSSGTALSQITSFPIYISALTGPSTQKPIGYHVEVISNGNYETLDSFGRTKMVNNGDSVYSKHYDTDKKLDIMLTAASIDLENNVEYTIKCTASLDSGLTAEASVNLPVAWVDEVNVPNAEIFVDSNTLVGYIRPYCMVGDPEMDKRLEIGTISSLTGVESDRSSRARTIAYYDLNDLNIELYIINPDITYMTYFYDEEKNFITYKSWSSAKNLKNVEGCRYVRFVFKYSDTHDITSDDIYELQATMSGTYIGNPELDDDVTLSVYRREFDGSYTEIGTGLANTEATYITDPHPSLDYARYRITATSKTTGAMSYYDVPGYPVKEDAIVIQWADTWQAYDAPDDGNSEPEQLSWSGSMLKLLYNVDVSDASNRDVSLIEYVGRKHPVSYHGTQLGETSTWNVEIEKDDAETLHAIRRLKAWMGDVYVREPSGTGYWASVSVSYSQKHCELTIPVTLNLTRVEGGM